jgi:hypothetical protein
MADKVKFGLQRLNIGYFTAKYLENRGEINNKYTSKRTIGVVAFSVLLWHDNFLPPL